MKLAEKKCSDEASGPRLKALGARELLNNFLEAAAKETSPMFQQRMRMVEELAHAGFEGHIIFRPVRSAGVQRR